MGGEVAVGGIAWMASGKSSKWWGYGRLEDGDVMPECGEEMDEMRVCEVPNNKYIEVFEKYSSKWEIFGIFAAA